MLMVWSGLVHLRLHKEYLGVGQFLGLSAVACHKDPLGCMAEVFDDVLVLRPRAFCMHVFHKVPSMPYRRLLVHAIASILELHEQEFLDGRRRTISTDSQLSFLLSRSTIRLTRKHISFGRVENGSFFNLGHTML